MKTIRYVYYTAESPPAPLVHVSLVAPGGTEPLNGQTAQVDTGAFKSVLPKMLVDQLALTPVLDLTVEGLNGAIITLSTYLFQLAVKDLSPIVIEVLASDHESRTLLGRDVLNRYTITLDGPSLKLTIVEP